MPAGDCRAARSLRSPNPRILSRRRRVLRSPSPLKSLRGFSRVNIPAGETVEVVFPLTEEVFLSWNAEKKDMLPAAGEWELLCGGSSDKLQSVSYVRK